MLFLQTPSGKPSGIHQSGHPSRPARLRSDSWCGGLSVIGDVYKSEAYELSRFINKEDEIIPWHTINKAPSAELRPDQKDSDSLPDYNILDAILYQYIECSKSKEEIVAQGFDEAVVAKTIRMVNRNEFKRQQVAPICASRLGPLAQNGLFRW